MELRQLRYFVTVAEEESFTRAARRLHVAQPGISAQVRKLEDELGEPLLDRSDRSVRLTAAGVEVLPHARAALASAEAARSAVTELAGLTRGRVRVGTVPSCPVVELPGHLASFHRRFPGIDISLSEANGDDLVKAIEEGDIDVAVVGAAGEPNPRLRRVELTDERLLAAVRRDHPLAGRASHCVPCGVRH
jgi:DNA-binding transcriptional LysR family regulator